MKSKFMDLHRNEVGRVFRPLSDDGDDRHIPGLSESLFGSDEEAELLNVEVMRSLDVNTPPWVLRHINNSIVDLLDNFRNPTRRPQIVKFIQRLEAEHPVPALEYEPYPVLSLRDIHGFYFSFLPRISGIVNQIKDISVDEDTDIEVRGVATEMIKLINNTVSLGYEIWMDNQAGAAGEFRDYDGISPRQALITVYQYLGDLEQVADQKVIRLVERLIVSAAVATLPLEHDPQARDLFMEINEQLSAQIHAGDTVDTSAVNSQITIANEQQTERTADRAAGHLSNLYAELFIDQQILSAPEVVDENMYHSVANAFSNLVRTDFQYARISGRDTLLTDEQGSKKVGQVLAQLFDVAYYYWHRRRFEPQAYSQVPIAKTFYDIVGELHAVGYPVLEIIDQYLQEFGLPLEDSPDLDADMGEIKQRLKARFQLLSANRDQENLRLSLHNDQINVHAALTRSLRHGEG